MIDKPIIEALASLGTGIAPRFHWDADALSLKSAIDSLAVNRLSLPGACDNYDALMAMAMGQHLTKVLTERHELPQKQFRRVATLAMQFGAALVEIALTLKGHQQKVVALLNAAQTSDPLLNEKPTLQTLLIAATCASKMPEGEATEVILACQKLLMVAGGKQELITLVGNVMDAVQTAESTKDFAQIAGSLFPDVGESCQDDDEGETDSQPHDDQKQPQTQPADSNEPGETGDKAEGEPSDSKSGEPDEAAQEVEVGEKSGQRSDAQGSESDADTSAGAGTQPATESATDKDVEEEVQGQSDQDNCESGNQSQEPERADESSEEVNSAKNFSEQGSEDDAESQELEEEAAAESTNTQGDEAEQTSEENSQAQEGAAANDKPESKEEGEAEAEGAETLLEKLTKGGFSEIKDSAAGSKLQFAKNQSLVSELVRILQSEDKRTTSIQDRGRKIAANKIWRFKKLGDARIFKQTNKVVGSQIAVELLIDASGSMGSHLTLACEVGLSFCDALQRLTKASSAMSLFAGRVGVSRVLKEHGEGFSKIAPKLTSVAAGGGTPTGFAMMQRLEVLVRQAQERKLMVVITDGAANDFRSVLQSMKYAEDNGIDVIGIGLGLEGRVIKTYIENSLNILSLNDLQPAIRALMSKRALAKA